MLRRTAPLKIVSGGQSGADIGGTLAGLAAIERGYPVETGGWGHPKLDSEYAPKWKRVAGQWVNTSPGIPEENARIVGAQERAGLQRWPVKINFNAGTFGPGERQDIIDTYKALHYGKPVKSQHFPRTAANVIDHDLTVLIGELKGGTLDTKNIADYVGRPWLHNPTGQELAQWVIEHPEIKSVNIAGRRQTEGLKVDDDLEARANKVVSEALDILYG